MGGGQGGVQSFKRSDRGEASCIPGMFASGSPSPNVHQPDYLGAVIRVVDIEIAVLGFAALSLASPRPPHAEFKLDVDVAEYDTTNHHNYVSDRPTVRADSVWMSLLASVHQIGCAWGLALLRARPVIAKGVVDHVPIKLGGKAEDVARRHCFSPGPEPAAPRRDSHGSSTPKTRGEANGRNYRPRSFAAGYCSVCAGTCHPFAQVHRPPCSAASKFALPAQRRSEVHQTHEMLLTPGGGGGGGGGGGALLPLLWAACRLKLLLPSLCPAPRPLPIALYYL